MEPEGTPKAERSEIPGILGKVVLAIGAGLAATCLMAYTAWSETGHAPATANQQDSASADEAASHEERAPASGVTYSESELRALETSDESKIRELRHDEITQLRIALGRHAPSNRRADLYLRLAEIYIEAYRADYILEGRVHEKRLERGESDKFIDHSHSRPNLSAGITACKEILSFHIPFEKLDEVYYFLGFNYSELGDRPSGIQYFGQLTQRFPGSPYVGEAYKEMGDASFDAGDFRKAQAYLELALKHASPDAIPRIDHRLAWCYYRTKQFDRAVETMKAAISSAQNSGEKYLSLREEALRDMALFMTETGKTDEAITYFTSVVSDKKFYPQVLEKLGKQYERNVEPAKATMVYESLLKTNPDAEATFRVRVKLVDLDLRRARYHEALARLTGAQIPTGGENETQVAAQNLRAMIRRTATEHHEKYRKTGNRSELEIAESYYTAYLNIFLAQADWRRETPEIQMYLAEIKRELGKSKEASDLYRTVLESKDKRYAKEAGALWTASLSEAIRKQAKANPNAAAKSTDPSALELEFIDAADRLQDVLGDTNEGREAALRAAEVLAGYSGTKSDAIKRIRKIIQRVPESPQALTTARLWLQISESSNDDLIDVMKDLRANTALMASDQKAGGKLHVQLADLDARLKIGVIANEEKKSDFASAARDYEGYGNDSTNRDTAEKSYVNAVSSYLKVGDAESIDRVSKTWLKRYPKSPRAIESLRGAATSFLVAGNFSGTARTFERLGLEAGDADALETAARILAGSGDEVRAQKAQIVYLATYANNPHAASVALDLARSLEAAQQEAQAAASYKTCMADSTELYAECGSRLADLYLRTQDIDAAKSMYRKVGGQRSTASVVKHKKKKKKKADEASETASGPASSPFVGYARYKLASLMEQEAKFDRLEMPEATLKKALNRRLNFLEPLSRAYLSAVEAGGPWAVAALDRLAAFAMSFADEVDNINPPPQADSDAIARFRKNLGSVSNPLRRKAVATWTEAYTKAVASETLSPALPEIVDRLADARADRPARAQGFHGLFRLAGIAADGGDSGKTKALETVRGKLTKNPQDSAAWVDYGNLMWGEGRPLLARIAYERALSLNSRNPAALNNRGVVLVSSEGEEDWQGSLEGAILFRDALKQDEFFIAAKMNRAALFNYYRLFEKAKQSWDQVVIKDPEPDVQDGLGVALQGLGQADAAQAAFAKATSGGNSSSRFVVAYHDAARAALLPDGGDKCLSRLSDLDAAALPGFEKASVEHLKRTCTTLKSEAKTK